MPKKEVTDARFHTPRNAPDGGTAASSAPCPYWRSSAPRETCPCAGRCWYAQEKAERETAAGHESVDGVHPRQARKEKIGDA